MSPTKPFSLLGTVRKVQEKKPVPPANSTIESQETKTNESQAKTNPAGSVLSTNRKSLFGSTQPKSNSTQGLAHSPTVVEGEPLESSSSGTDVSAGKSTGAAVSVGTAKHSGLLQTLAKQKEKQDAIKADHAYLFTEEPKDFRDLLDRFDSLVNRDTGIDEFNLAPCRDYVQRIYTDLRNQPELEGLLLDKDVGNIIHFIRTVKDQALESGQKKAEKAAAKGPKSTAASNRFGATALDLDFSAKPKASTIQDIADIDIDALKM